MSWVRVDVCERGWGKGKKGEDEGGERKNRDEFVIIRRVTLERIETEKEDVAYVCMYAGVAIAAYMCAYPYVWIHELLCVRKDKESKERRTTRCMKGRNVL